MTRAYNAFWGLEVQEDPFGGSRTVRLARKGVRAGDLVEACPLLYLAAEPHEIVALSARATVCKPSDGPVDVGGDSAPLGVKGAFLPGGFACLYRIAQPGREEANLEPRVEGNELFWFARRPLRGGDELLAPRDWARLLDVGAVCAGLAAAAQNLQQDSTAALGSRAGSAPAERLPGPGHVLHGPSPVHRSGVFSAKAYAVGEVVEVCPALKLSGAAAKAVRDYSMMCSDSLSSGLYGEWVSSSLVLALGLGAVYNHREVPQLEWFYDEETEAVVFAAVQRIEAGEELFISYGDSYWQGRGLKPS